MSPAALKVDESRPADRLSPEGKFYRTSTGQGKAWLNPGL